MDNVTIHAHAKVNLTLTITGRRDDGYHLMDSLVVFADLADHLSIFKSDADTLFIKGQHATALQNTPHADNILIKAADLYRQYCGFDQRYEIHLEKNIPVAAGIGGGSSDAAAMLMALNSLNPAPISDDDLSALGLKLGADLPVCLKQYQHPVWRMEGIGETLSIINFDGDDMLEDKGLVLFNPMVGVSTGQVFKGLDQHLINAAADRFHANNLAAWLTRGNDLTAPAQAIEPLITTCLEALSTWQDLPGYLHHGMSGSGATLFALFDKVEDAHHAQRHLPQHLQKGTWSWSGGLSQDVLVRGS